MIWWGCSGRRCNQPTSLCGCAQAHPPGGAKSKSRSSSITEPIEIPYGATTLPGTFYHVDDSGRPHPTVIATNGYGATVQGMHFSHAAAAVRRGYNCLIFDGPAPRRVLYKQGIHMRPDGENIVSMWWTTRSLATPRSTRRASP